MLVKFISKTKVEPYRGLVEIDGVVYTNDEEKAKAVGFKPLVIDEAPASVEGYCAVSYYEECESTIYLRWMLEPVSEDEV